MKRLSLICFSILATIIFTVSSVEAKVDEIIHIEGISIYQDSETEKVIVVQDLGQTKLNLSDESPPTEFFNYFGAHKMKEERIHTSDKLTAKRITLNLGGKSSSYLQYVRLIHKKNYIFTTDLNENDFQKFLQDFSKQTARRTASFDDPSGRVGCAFRLGIDNLLKNSEDYWVVACQTDSSHEKSNSEKMIGGLKSCLSGAEVSLLQLVKFVKDVAEFFLDMGTDSKYRSEILKALGGILLKAATDPVGVMKEIYTTITQAMEESFSKLKSCSLDYKISFICKTLVSWVTGGMIGLKAIKKAGALLKGSKNVEQALVRKTSETIVEQIENEAKAVKDSPYSKNHIQPTIKIEATANADRIVKVGNETVSSQRLNQATDEVRSVKRTQSLATQLKNDPVLNGLISRAGDSFQEIAKLSKQKATKVLKAVGEFTDEELNIFKEEVRRPGWSWCQ